MADNEGIKGLRVTFGLYNSTIYSQFYRYEDFVLSAALDAMIGST
jgi:hypothetical protein